ncbi:MAG: hypothetical protein LUD48_01150 [Prevotella sp.]|nr:hypothetical protein [Prevotella sp.]
MKKFFFLISLLLGAVTAPAFAEDYFDLSAINPSIVGTGTYDSSTHHLYTGEYGFGGWEYSTPIDLSGYSKIVIELEEGETDGAQFRLITGYYNDDNAAIYNFDWGSTTLEIDLTNMVTDTDNGITIGENFDLSSISMAGFWTFGATDDAGIIIKSITLSKSSDNDVVATSDYFDLSAINPSIVGTGTYDSSTHHLYTGEYGFGGWEYSTPIDLSGYSKIVIELEEGETDGAQFRLITGYYNDDNAAIYNFDWGSTTLEIDLTNMVTDTDNGITIGENFDLSSISMAGFWTFGATDDAGIIIKSITLYQNASDDEEGTTGINTVPALATQSKNGVYTLTGVKVSDDASSLKSLSRGIYIINGRKVVVR